MPQSAILTVMINAARKAARGIKRDFGEVENLQVSLKGPANFVTRADRRAEETVQAELARARPTYGFLMEEGGVIEGTDGQHQWIIDPIDGTTNFIHGIPHFAISIGLRRGKDLVAGVIYNPISEELYTAERGRGAYLNDRRLRVSARKEMADAVVACGLPHRGRGDHPQFRQELTILQGQVAGLRRFGAASLDLAYVAAGRFDAFWERRLSPWDMAAGLIILREAGGVAGDIDGQLDPIDSGNILAASSDALFSQLRKTLKSG